MSFSRSSIFLTIASVIIIIFAIVITSIVQGPSPKAFSQIITVGPIWTKNSWSCTSDADFIVNAALRGLGNSSRLTIAISGLGSQSLYSLDAGKMQTFTLGSPAGHNMSLIATGTVTGWITLQTTSGAKASCTQP